MLVMDVFTRRIIGTRQIPHLSFRGLRAPPAPLQLLPRPMSDFIHRTRCFREEWKDRVDVDGILDEPQRHTDTSFLRALG